MKAGLPVAGNPLDEQLRARSRAGDLFTTDAGSAVRCSACAHRCYVQEGSAGACRVRFNRDGVLQVPFGYIARRYVRAVETNTVYHVLPGAKALTFGMFGCDLKCPYCHNHKLSQALRDGPSAETPLEMQADALVAEALAGGCRALCAAYNEPMISAEWTRHVFSAAKRSGLVTALISDGNSTSEALSYMRPVTDVFRVDLKGADDATYRTLGGRLSPVLESIERARNLGFWVEVVTLFVPGLNHDVASVRTLAGCLRDISPDLPWHLNGFVPRYKLSQSPPADAGFLVSAVGTAYAAGLRYVYMGNIAGQDELSHTRCPECTTVLVRRSNYTTVENHLDGSRCPHCRATIPGLWGGTESRPRDGASGRSGATSALA